MMVMAGAKMGKENQKYQMNASYTGNGKPAYEDSQNEDVESEAAYYGSNSQLAQNKPYYIANKSMRYKEYR